MIEQGRITNVVIDDAGSELVTDAAIAATTLFVADAYPFSSDGGVLEVNGITYAYTAVDYELNTITVAALSVAAVTEDRVYVSPRGAIKVAQVILEDDDEGVRAIVPFGLQDAIDDGIRDFSEQEIVFISDETGRWEVKSLDEEIPTRDGAYMDSSTLPPSEDPLPAIAPPLDVISGPTAVIVLFENLRLTYELHFSATDPGAAAPTALTLHTDNFISGQYTHVDSAGVPLVADTDYWWNVRVRNAAGTYAPDSTVWHAGQAKSIPEEYLSLIVGDLIALRLFGSVIEGVTIRSSVLDIVGSLHAEPGFVDIIADKLTAYEALFTDNVDMRGLSNYLRGSLRATAGVPDPSQTPSVVPYWPSVTTEAATLYPADHWHGLCPRIGFESTEVVSTYSYYGGVYGVRAFNLTTGALISGFSKTLTNFAPIGITANSTHYYIVGTDLSGVGDPIKVRKYDSTLGTLVATYDIGVNASDTADVAIGLTSLTSEGFVVAYMAYINDDRVTTKRYNSNGGLIDTVQCVHNLGTMYNIGGVVQYEHSAGVHRTLIATTNASQPILAFDANAGTRTSSIDVPHAGSNIIHGLYRDGTRLRHLSRTGTIRTYSTYIGGDPAAKFTYVDAGGGIGFAESGPSQEGVPAAGIQRGAWILVTTTPPPNGGGLDDPDRNYIYLAPASGGSFFRAATLTPGDLDEYFEVVPTSGTALDLTSDFTGRSGSAIGQFISQSGNSYVRGDDTAALPKLIQSGEGASGTLVVDTNKDIAVVFAVPFNTVPNVVCNPVGLNSPNGALVWAANITTTGFNLRFRRASTTAFSAAWIATVA